MSDDGGLRADRRELLQLWLEAEAVDETVHVEPVTPAERAMAAIWSDVLEVDRVGLDDDYFAIGGDSILAIMIITRCQRAGLDLSTGELFATPTIRRLCAGAGPPAPPVEPDKARYRLSELREYPLTPLQEGMLYHTMATPSSHPYLVQVTSRLEGDIDVADMARAWQILADRTPALRLGFHRRDDTFRQVEQELVRIPVVEHDLSELDEPAREQTLAAQLAADRERGFDPAVPPLLRVAIYRLAADAALCAITHHHLLLDGWSQQLLLSRLLIVYDGLADSTDRGSPGVELSPDGFAEHIQRSASRDLQPAIRYWTGRLRGAVPTRIRGRDADEGPYGDVQHRLSASALRALPETCRRHRITPSTAVQGAWALVLSHLTGSRDVVFGLTVSGRPADEPGITSAVGMFINTLPMRVAVAAERGVTDWLRDLQAGQAPVQDLAHTPLPVVERCRSDGGTGPLFDSLLVIENFPSLVDEGHRSRRLRVGASRSDTTEGYPLVLEVRSGGRHRVRHDTSVVDGSTAAGLLAGLACFLERITAEASMTVSAAAEAVAIAVAGGTAAERDRLRAAESVRLGAARRHVTGPRT